MRRHILALAALAPFLSLSACTYSTVQLEANQQITWIASQPGDAAVRNSGDTILTIVEEDASREPVAVIDLQPRDRLTFNLAEGERLTVMSSYNLPAEFRLGYTGDAEAALTKEGPSPAPPLRRGATWTPYSAR